MYFSKWKSANWKSQKFHLLTVSPENRRLGERVSSAHPILSTLRKDLQITAKIIFVIFSTKLVFTQNVQLFDQKTWVLHQKCTIIVFNLSFLHANEIFLPNHLTKPTLFMLFKVAGFFMIMLHFFLKIENVLSYYPRRGCIRSIRVWKLSWQSFYALTLLSAQALHLPTSQIEIPKMSLAPFFKHQTPRITAAETHLGKNNVWFPCCSKLVYPRRAFSDQCTLLTIYHQNSLLLLVFVFVFVFVSFRIVNILEFFFSHTCSCFLCCPCDISHPFPTILRISITKAFPHPATAYIPAFTND